MAVCEGWEVSRGLHVADLDIVINRAEKLLERVGKAFIVAARIIREWSDAWLQQSRIADQQFVGSVTMPQPKLVGPFAVPGEGAFAAGDLEAQAVFAAGGDLR